MDDLISKETARRIIDSPRNKEQMLRMLKSIPSAQPYTIHSDGRLWITVDDIDKVTAVVVDEHKSKFCKQFYEDYEDAQPEIIRCKDCKHYKYGICKKAGLCVNKSPNGFCDWGEEGET